MVETAPQSLTESAHMVCLPQAACGQFHMSFWNRKPSWFQVPSPALDSQLGCCGIDANEAVAGTSRAVAAASRVKARFSIGLPLRSDAWRRPRSDMRHRWARYSSEADGGAAGRQGGRHLSWLL